MMQAADFGTRRRPRKKEVLDQIFVGTPRNGPALRFD
jgi:hypothetical protein